MLCAAIIVPALSLAALLAWSYSRSEQTRIEERVVGLAREVRVAMDRDLQGLLGAMQVLSLSQALSAHDFETFDSQAREVYRQLGVNVVLRNRASQQLVNTRVPRGAPLPSNVDIEADQEVLAGGPLISNLILGAVTQMPLYMATVPVREQDQVAYFLNMSLPPTRVRDIIRAFDRPIGWRVTVVDRLGHVVADSEAEETLSIRRLPGRLLAAIGTEGDGFVRGDLLEPGSDPALVGFGRSRLSGWTVLVTVPIALAEEALLRSIALLTAGALSLVALSGGFALILGRRIAEPVVALSVEAARLGRGEAVRPLAARTVPREVAAVGEALALAAAMRAEAEHELRDREARLRSILETVPSAMVVIDSGGAIESFSATAESLFGWPAREAVGQDVAILLAGPDRARCRRDLMATTPASEGPVVNPRGPVPGARRDGSSFPMELYRGEVRLGGRPFFTVFIRDLTERQAAERKQRELQAELLHVSRLSAAGEMASELAHELNQPLTVIATCMQTALRMIEANSAQASPDATGSKAPPVDDKLATVMELATRQSLRAGEIISHLRHFVAKGDAEIRLEDIAQVIEEARTLALVGVGRSDLHVAFDVPEGLPPVLIDRVQVLQVLVNLMRNAVEAMDDHPDTPPRRRELSVSARLADQGDIVVAVSDTGPGLAPEVSANLFNPFVSTKPTGMGVGLSICRTIVEAHGGRIWHAPNRDGGAVFRFTLPADVPEVGEDRFAVPLAPGR